MKRKGITIIELVMYMSILSVLLLFFTDMFATLVNRQLETESLSVVQQDANYLMARLSYDFLDATSITVPATPGATSSSLQLGGTTVPTTISLNAGLAVLSKGGNTFILNSPLTTISNLVFQRLGTGAVSDVVRVQFDISSTIQEQSGTDVTHFSTTLGIREK